MNKKSPLFDPNPPKDNDIQQIEEIYEEMKASELALLNG